MEKERRINKKKCIKTAAEISYCQKYDKDSALIDYMCITICSCNGC